MNNQIPFFNDGNFNPNGYPNNYPQNNVEMMYGRINNRLNRLERQVRIIENRLNRLENVNIMPLKNNQDDNDMYML